MMRNLTWKNQLKTHLPNDYFSKIDHFLDTVYQEETVYPPREQVFLALDKTSLKDVKVIILGQDPYHGKGQAQGLSFSVPDTVIAPPSLQNILKELAADVGVRSSHDLTTWAEQGVLLLNSCLTVPKGKANGHAGRIWEPLTDAVIQVVNEKEQPVVFILWGAYAQKKKSLITSPHHLVLTAPHPSPLSAYRGFFGSKPFSKTNTFLKQAKEVPIDWLR